jgi:hypothetical protein
MRLTNIIRDAFVRAAMQDVPQTDYVEEMRKVAQDDAVAQLPPKVRALYQDKELSHYVNTVYRSHGGYGVNVPGAGDFSLTDKAKAKISEMRAALEAQQERMKGLQNKLRNCAYGCKTRKALVDMLPEFEKYLPADDAAACRTLPAVANVVSEFVKAGWPKDAKKQTKKAA